MTAFSKIPEELRKKFKTLKMLPTDWSTMWNALNSEEDYRTVVMDYQNRKWETLPKCKTWFGVCKYYDRGRCFCSKSCSSKAS